MRGFVFLLNLIKVLKWQEKVLKSAPISSGSPRDNSQKRKRKLSALEIINCSYTNIPNHVPNFTTGVHAQGKIPHHL